MKLITFLSLTIFLLSMSFGVAKADYFVWADPQTGLSFSFPDDWQRVSSADPDDIITVMPPSGRAHAACRIRARNDMRYSVYPVHYANDIQKVAYGLPYMNEYLREYDDPQILSIMDNGGLGRGFATYAVVSYKSAVQGPLMERKATVFAAYYADRVYFLECSSHKDAYAMWENMFLSIAKSIDFKKADHELVSGNYRNFLPDPYKYFSGDEGMNVVRY
jgi:hypothetical protein